MITGGRLARQLLGGIIVLVVGTVTICWVLNTVFLELYYMENKQDTLIDSFRVINEASASGKLNDASFNVTFENLCANNNITVLIISADRTIVRSSISDTQLILSEFLDIIFGERTNEIRVLVQEDDYVIQRQTDLRLSSEYLVLYGTLSNGNMILMRSALESIRESVKIANQFLLYVAILAIIVSVFVGLLMSRWVTQPVVRLTDLSRRMAELDFEAKYIPKRVRQNEIDELGEHMNALSEALERTISELKSANNRLLVDIEEKTKIDEMRKEFLSNVSHELKTPIALIQGYAEGLLEGINEDEESRNFYCEVIVDEAEKMNLMVKKILTLSQLESGGETVTMSHFDLTEMIHGALRQVEILLEQSGVIVAEYPKDPMYVWADEFKTEEVLTNYLSNAIHHAKGLRQIEIRYEERGELLRVCVFNTGELIPEEDLEKIWLKFYKVDKAHTREYGGSGIGLSIVRAIMEAMHRECGVVNHEDGVEFWFELDRSSH